MSPGSSPARIPVGSRDLPMLHGSPIPGLARAKGLIDGNPSERSSRPTSGCSGRPPAGLVVQEFVYLAGLK